VIMAAKMPAPGRVRIGETPEIGPEPAVDGVSPLDIY